MSALTGAAGSLLSTPLGAMRAIGRWLRFCALIVLVAVLAALAYSTWVRDLPVFAIERVQIEGTDDDGLASALSAAARTMTTLHTDPAGLERVASQFPAVASVAIEPSFPTGATVTVREHVPVATAELDEGRVAVAADGTLLPGIRGKGTLPSIRGRSEGGRLAGRALGQAGVLGAAPAPLLALVEAVQTRRRRGIAVTLQGGVEVRFGTPNAATRKWEAAAAVIADERLTGLAYVDVSVPERPSVGGATGGPPIDLEVEVAPVESAAAVDPLTGGEEAVAGADPAAIAPDLATEPAVPEASITP